MADNITPFPPPPAPKDPLVGPFTVFPVVVEGRQIPRLTGFYDGDKIALVVDGRFSHSFSREDAYPAAWLLACALAVGEGYTHLGALSKDRPFAPEMVQLGGYGA